MPALPMGPGAVGPGFSSMAANPVVDCVYASDARATVR